MIESSEKIDLVIKSENHQLLYDLKLEGALIWIGALISAVIFQQALLVGSIMVLRVLTTALD